MAIQRFTFEVKDGELQHIFTDSGEFVRYNDYMAEVSSLRSRINSQTSNISEEGARTKALFRAIMSISELGLE